MLYYKSVEWRTTQVYKKRVDVWILQWKSQEKDDIKEQFMGIRSEHTGWHYVMIQWEKGSH